MLIIAKDRYLCTLNKAFFSIMQNKTDKETLLVSKSSIKKARLRQIT